VEGLAAGADPSSALFTHVPMWVQFRNISFYLLTKKLAHDLGDHWVNYEDQQQRKRLHQRQVHQNHGSAPLVHAFVEGDHVGK